MKRFPKTEFLSFFSILLGIVGMGLQGWLFSNTDKEGLLPRGHIAELLSLILLGVVFVVNYLFLRTVRPNGGYDQLFPKSIPSFIGFLLAAIGLLFSSLTITASGVILIAIYVLGILSGFALAYAGYCRLRGEPTNCLLFAVIAAYMIFRTLAACQTWSSEVQVQYYVFPLLANLTLLLAAFYRAAIGADMGNCRRYLLFRNVAVFCCMLSIVSGDWLFFLAGAVWMITDFCDPFLYGKYAV